MITENLLQWIDAHVDMNDSGQTREDLLSSLSAALDENQRLAIISNDLYSCISKPKYIDTFMRKISSHLNNPVMYQDVAHKVVAYYSDIDIKDSHWNNMINSGTYDYSYADSFFYDSYKKLIHSQQPLAASVDYSDYAWMSCALLHNNECYGYLAVPNVKHDFTDYDHKLLKLCSDILAFRISMIDSSQTEMTYLVRRLISGDALSEEEFNVLSKSTNVSSFYKVLVSAIDSNSRVYAKRISLSCPLGINVKTFFENNQQIILLEASNLDAMNSYVKLCEAYADEYQLHVGASNIFYSLLYLFKAFTQSSHALRFARESKDKYYCVYADYILEDFLYEISEQISCDFYTHPALTILKEYDANTNHQLALTLYTYFSNNKSIQKTCAELFLHKNTIVFRINKIKDLTGIDLNDPETVFHYLLSYRLLKV